MKKTKKIIFCIPISQLFKSIVHARCSYFDKFDWSKIWQIWQIQPLPRSERWVCQALFACLSSLPLRSWRLYQSWTYLELFWKLNSWYKSGVWFFSVFLFGRRVWSWKETLSAWKIPSLYAISQWSLGGEQSSILQYYFTNEN